MDAMFLTLLDMSVTAGLLTLVVLLLRVLFKKAPKWILVCLWGFVAVRLLCPFVPESAWSLMPSDTVVTVGGETVAVQGIPEAALPPVVQPTADSAPVSFLTIAAVVWLIGAACMLLYAVGSCLLLRFRLRGAVPLEGRVRLSDYASSPFILGVFRPRIYLPSSMSPDDHAAVLAHERAHLKRLDHVWKPLGFVLLTLHWFNPLLWVAYILLCRDIELACDERVIRDRTLAEKKAYSETLIRCSVSRRSLTACPLAFGETAVKERIKAVLFYKKPAFWVIVIAVIACAAVAVCFLTDPQRTPSSTGKSQAWATFLCTEFDHDFAGATCTANGICRRCDAEGTVLPHTFSAATCVAGETCADCGASGAQALGHDFVGATCTTPASCSRCAVTGDVLPHTYAAATCDTAETCTACGAVGETAALGHNFTEATCTTDGACTRCGAVGDPAHGHDFAVSMGSQTCRYCGYTEYIHNVHLTKCTGYTCDICGTYIEGSGNHTYIQVGFFHRCVVCGESKSIGAMSYTYDPVPYELRDGITGSSHTEMPWEQHAIGSIW